MNKKQKEWLREYRKRPEVKAKRNAYLREYNKRRYRKDYNNALARTLKQRNKAKILVKKYKTIPKKKIDYSFGIHLLKAITFRDKKYNKRGREWERIVGYTSQELIHHLEKQFNDKMNWNNRGSYWQIDHIKPKCAFNYTTTSDKEFKECWSLENLRPLERIKNMEKGQKLIK